MPPVPDAYETDPLLPDSQIPLVSGRQTLHRSLPADAGEKRDYEELEGDGGTYAAVMALSVRDLTRLARNTKHPEMRASRLMASLLQLYVLIFLQMFMLVQIKTFCTSPYIKDIRENYDKYERTMYNGHVVDSGYGFGVGKGGPKGQYFDESRFNKLTEDEKHNICIIPLTQFPFIFIVVFIWTLTIIGELKTCFKHAVWFIDQPAVASLLDSHRYDESRGEDVIVGVTVPVKILLFVMVVLPRTIVALLLWWLGARWLTATMDFDDILVNCVALTFVIELNGLLYDNLMSSKNKEETETCVLDQREHGRKAPSIMSFVGPFAWGIGGAIIVYFYLTQWQGVLPGYQWDVKESCKEFVNHHYNFWRK